MTDRQVHPVAAQFPMLPAEELRSLAADIKARGLLHAIVVDQERQILDGRNRLAACEIAEVEPTFETYEGDDPDGYALAVNGQRRDMSKGRKAMVAARALLVSNKTQKQAANEIGVSQPRVAEAVVVRDHAPDLADLVISGVMPLDEAAPEARKRKKDKDSDEAKLAKLQENAPDLAELVTEERLSLKEADQTLQQREKDLADQRRDATALLNRVIGLIVPEIYDSETYVHEWADLVIQNDIRADRFDQAIEILTKLREALWTSPST